jgi:DNA-binding transcriptional MerR regulator
MEYRVEELAEAAGVGVDTVRFYQARGLLPPPARRGRVAVYSSAHLARLRRVRALNRSGLTLAAVRRALAKDPGAGDAGGADPVSPSLLAALAETQGSATYTREELAAATGVPPLMLDAILSLCLLQPASWIDGAPRYTEQDREALHAARTLLEAGLPADELLALARAHAAHVAALAERAVALFAEHVRRKHAPDPPRAEEVAERLRELLPAATSLIALHFHGAVVRMARARLSADHTAPSDVAAATAAAGAAREATTP